MSKRPPLALIILDGWGLGPKNDINAIHQAATPHWDEMMHRYPCSALSASGEDVGLDAGQMGNSEVGHLNIGAGRIVYQDSTRIHRAIESGDFNNNPTLLATFERCKAKDSCLHIMGLLSPGGVHSHQNHIDALLQAAHINGVRKVQLHAFLDGRDVPPKSAKSSLETIEARLKQCGFAPVASITGRYWAMDRDKRWERTESTYNMLTQPQANAGLSSVEALLACYERGETDEFISPTWLQGAPMTDGDEVVFMNFRADRARQLCLALTDASLDAFPRTKLPSITLSTLTAYSDTMKAHVLFEPVFLRETLGQVLSEAGLKQLRLAETEKYAHVTFFFNGGIETAFPNEKRVLIPSPKVSTYDLKPAMSAIEITDAFIAALESKDVDVIICNYANADMVGHSGMMAPTVKAIESLDQCLGRVLRALEQQGGHAFITSDHGNAECMFDEKAHQPHTAHTLNEVPFLYTDASKKLRAHGILADCAPSILTILGLQIPSEMTGQSLFLD